MISSGTLIRGSSASTRCPACFDNYLRSLDVGFLDSYRRFGCRSRLVVAETCLRGLVVESPDHRKALAKTIFEQYLLSLTDLVGLFAAFGRRQTAPIVKTFLEFRLDAASVAEFYRGVAADPILRPLYPEEDLGPAEERLRMFLEQYWGGPGTYSQQRGHPRLRMRHAPYRVTPDARDRWLHHMRAGVDELALPPHLADQLWDYLVRAAYSMVNTMEQP